MKIAVFHELPITSGSRKSVDNFSKLLSKKHTVDLYYTDKKKTQESAIYRKIFFFKFDAVAWKGNNWKTRLYRDSIELLKLYFLHQKIARKIDKEKYDFVFINGSYLTESPFILRFLKSKKVYYAHAPNYTLVFEKVMGVPNVNTYKYIYEKINRFIRKEIDIANVRKSDLILANSQYTKAKIRDFYHKKSTVSYLGVDINTYKPRNIDKTYDLLFVGSYHPVDGYFLLKQALDFMKKKPSLKVLAVEDEWVSSDLVMAKIYNSAKIVVCLAHDEPFGLVAIEAMACGLPVIAVNEAGYKETVVEGKTGVLIKRDFKDLAKSINKILKNERIYEKFSVNARDFAVNKWSWEFAAANIERMISKKI